MSITTYKAEKEKDWGKVSEATGRRCNTTGKDGMGQDIQVPCVGPTSKQGKNGRAWEGMPKLQMGREGDAKGTVTEGRVQRF